MNRKHIILTSVLAVQIILSVVVFWPRSAATSQGEPLFPDLTQEGVTALTVTDAEGDSITLHKATGEWTLPEADDFPVDATKVTPILEDLLSLTTDRLVTRTSSSHKQLQVDPNDYQRRIEFETAAGEANALYLGSSPSYGATHFRLANKNETYLTSDLSVWDINTTPSSWINTYYVNIPQEEITRVTLENANGTFVFNKDEDGNWAMEGLPEGETLNTTAVSTVVRQAGSIIMSRPLGREQLPAYGMDQPQAVVTVETTDTSVTMQVGAQDPGDNTYVVKSSESPYFVGVSEYTGNQLVQKTQADFLQQPTPTPEPSAG